MRSIRELNQITCQPYFPMPAFAGLRVKTSLRVTSAGRRATSNAKSNLCATVLIFSGAYECLRIWIRCSNSRYIKKLLLIAL